MMEATPAIDLMRFRYTPTAAAVVEGASFSLPYRLLASFLVGLSGVWLVALVVQGKLPAGSSAQSMALWFFAALLMMGWILWHVLRGKTRIDDQAISQDWIWKKQTELGSVAIARLIRLRGLEWLLAPRLYVRSLSGKLAIYHMADPALIAEAERLCAAVQAFRGGRG